MTADSIIKSFIAALKNDERLFGLSYIYSNRRDISQNPVAGFTLSIGIGKSQYEKNPSEGVISSEVTQYILCLMAPTGAGGKELLDKALCVSEVIKDTHENIKTVSVSEPVYNESSSVLYSDITVTVVKTVYEEVITPEKPEYLLYINNRKINGLIAFEASSSRIGKASLLDGYSYTGGKQEYTLSFKTDNVCTLPTKDFVLSFTSPKCTETYSGCFAEKIKRELNANGELIYIYELIAKAYQLS